MSYNGPVKFSWGIIIKYYMSRRATSTIWAKSNSATSSSDELISYSPSPRRIWAHPRRKCLVRFSPISHSAAIHSTKLLLVASPHILIDCASKDMRGDHSEEFCLVDCRLVRYLQNPPRMSPNRTRLRLVRFGLILGGFWSNRTGRSAEP